MVVDVLVVSCKADLFAIGIVLGITQSLCISQDYLNSALLVGTCTVNQQLFCRRNLEPLVLLFSTKLLLKVSCINVLEFLLNDLFLSLLEYIHNKITAREIVRGFLPDF